MSKKTKRPTHVSILGSCVCRDSFSIPQTTKDYGSEENEYVVDRYIQSISPLSAIGKPIDEKLSAALVEESKASSAPNFYKKCFMLDVTRTWENYLSEVKSDYLIIDFTTARLDCRKINNEYITYDDIGWKVFSGLGDDAKKEAMTNYMNGERFFLSDFSEVELRKIFYKYVDRILKLYPENKIIVVCARYARLFVDLNANQTVETNYSSDQRYVRENKLIDFAYSCAKEKLKKAHFIEALPVAVGNANHKWGKGGLHFVDETYLYIYRAIDAIIHGRMRKKMENLFLFELREKYSKQVIDNYLDVVNKCFQDNNNILDYSLGMEPGKYERNGVCLTVNSDYSFSIRGTASKETVFYLYQGRRNPLDEWLSVQADTPVGRYAFSTSVRNQGENFFIQLVLMDEEKNIKWVRGDYTSSVTLEKPYSKRLVRAILRPGVTVNVEGKLYLERVK